MTKITPINVHQHPWTTNPCENPSTDRLKSWIQHPHTINGAHTMNHDQTNHLDVGREQGSLKLWLGIRDTKHWFLNKLMGIRVASLLWLVGSNEGWSFGCFTLAGRRGKSKCRWVKLISRGILLCEIDLGMETSIFSFIHWTPYRRS